MSDRKFRASLRTKPLRDAISHVDRLVKRDTPQVSLVVGGGKCWLEGHGHFRHVQIALESDGPPEGKGVTMDQKVLLSLARKDGTLELSAGES